ncbi:tetratricopeptide repeat protein [Mucilaginibacter robiniae]|uniref:Tetratricopeptide repeat protein n=1 Tax=Mucilaginibacter robiniae TaxID=2728022 RepID=A0A7L5E7G1_9SPHI|nr:tetratricopeptide repeat protein [Mucilaginibacter robiniae]QJD96306.1 tetratricopeptide repeat protein [Mucilaginibacter robiniae]
MEVLKPIVGLTLGLCLAIQVHAQSAAAMQKAYQNSYANEYKKNYIAAINDIKPFYSDNDYETNLRLGWLYFLNKNYTASETYYARAVALRPNAVEAKFGYIKPLALLQSNERVLAQYNAILKIDPQNTQANYWTGYIYYTRKQYDTAIRYFTRLITLYPFDYDGNQMLGWSYLMAGNKANARVYFEKALLIKPEDASCTDGLSRAR